MPTARATFEVESFEYVDVGPDIVLLRLGGTWHGGVAPRSAALMVVSGGERVALSELPPRPAIGADGLWRAAFEASPRQLRAAFELDPATGAAIPLPAPTKHETPPPPGDEERAEDAARDTPVPERGAAPAPPEKAHAKAGRRFGKRRSVPGTTGAPTGETLDAIRSELEFVRRTLAHELASVRAQLEATKRELGSSKREVEAATRHLDTVHEAHALELASARRRRDQANERSKRAEQMLADTQEQLADRESTIEAARAEAARASGESAAVEEAVAQLRDAIAARAREAASSSRRRFSRDPEEVERAREEVRDGAERIAALERQAAALSEAIQAHLPPPSPVQEALPLDAPEGNRSDVPATDRPEVAEGERSKPDNDIPPVGAAPPTG